MLLKIKIKYLQYMWIKTSTTKDYTFNVLVTHYVFPSYSKNMK